MRGLERRNELVARGYGAAADYLAGFDSHRQLTSKITATARAAGGLRGILWLVLDLVGIGGPGEAGAPWGARVSRYGALGGDWSASDGPSWRSAAYALLHSCIGVRVRPVVATRSRAAGVELVAEYALGHDRRGDVVFLGVDDSLEAAKYIAALARRVLWQRAWDQSLVGAPPIHGTALRRACAIDGHIAAWSSVLGDAEGGPS